MAGEDDDVMRQAIMQRGIEPGRHIEIGLHISGVSGELAFWADGSSVEGSQVVAIVAAPQPRDGDGKVGLKRAIDDERLLNVEMVRQRRRIDHR